MDLGCLDLGCISVLEKQGNEAVAEKDGEAVESVTTATSKIGKNKGAKETVQSTLNAVNRSTSQIKKPHRRNSSPLNWFPRKKTDSYLKRKIRLLQEVGGMNSTLDETLGDSNPHYSRVLREKIAAREAAQKAMEARKAALVEASWCRILRAARIQSKEAESLLLKAEKSVAEAFEAAAAMGVVMYDRPDCPRKPCEIETSSVNLGGSTTHTVTASFETAFEVDKEVAAAVKNAFILLANCTSSSNKDEFRDLLWRISQNPDMNESNQELLSECSSGCELDTLSELESESLRYGSTSCHLNLKTPQTQLREGKCKNGRHPNVKSTKLVDMMLERLKCLHEDELSSLATIVATCGLNAALLEVENSKQHDHLASGVAYTVHPTVSSTGNSSSLKTGRLSHFDVPEIPSLDKFLVKHVSRLEKEVQEAKNRRKNEVKEELKEKPEGSRTKRLCDPNNHDSSSDIVPDLGSILVKHASKLEKEIEVAKKMTLGKPFGKECKQSGETKDFADLPGLDKFFVKHVSKLEREVEEAKKARKNNSEGVEENLVREMKQIPQVSQEGTENKLDKNSYFNSCNAVPGLGSILIKHSSKLEKEIAEEKKKLGNATEYYKSVHKKDVPEVPSLDKCLVKHTSRLEREVQKAKMTRKSGQLESRRAANSSVIFPASSSAEARNLNAINNVSFRGGKQVVGKENIDLNGEDNGALGGTLKERLQTKQTDNENTNMDVVPLPKNMSRIERAKLEALKAFSVQDGKEESDCGLDRILIKQVHRLEREKKMQALEGYGGVHVLQKHGRMDGSDCESLDNVLVKHQSRLEKEKLQSGDDQMKPSDTRQKAREKELQEAWGGLSLGNSIRPHLSRLERDKAAWMKAEEEEQRQAAAAIKEI